MKRVVKTGLALFLALLIPSGIIIAQDKKNEQKIKIVVTDKSGTTVELDTIIKGDTPVESIKLKNGEVFYLSKHGSGGTVKHIEGSDGEISVTVTTDSKGEKGEKGEKSDVKHVTIISSDPADIHENGEGGDVIILKSGTHLTEESAGKTFTITSSESGSKDIKYIYINEDKDTGKGGEKTVGVKVTTNENTKDVEMTKYVIAKDGMVVTIEGNDEAKVKEMIRDVESKLGVSKEDKNTKTVVKEETKKTTKK
jgi:hypothetical protein